MTPEELRALYQKRLAAAQQRAASAGARSRQVSNLRGLSFAVFAGAGVAIALGKEPAFSGAIAAGGLLAFVVLVVVHGRVLERESEANRHVAVNADALLRVSGRFRELRQNGQRFTGSDHPYADDLDLFGPGSLYQRISVAHTRFGEETLARYLKEPAGSAEIRERQRAARELSENLELRQSFEAHSFAIVHDERRDKSERRSVPDPVTLLDWAREKTGVSADPLVAWGARVLPLVTLGGLIAWTRGVTPALFLTTLIVQVYLLVRSGPACTRAFLACSATQGAFRSYRPMLALVEGLKTDSSLLAGLRDRLMVSGRPPSVAMGELERILGWYDLRHNGMVYPFINLFTLWDVHCTLALEGWRRRTGSALDGWFAVIGELEALSSLAGLAHDEPDFCFPELTDGPAELHAEDLAHPLIDRERRVPNSVTFEGPGSALLVTGSNMSGKSTLLRSLGIAAVLAFAGAPVCARKLRLPRLVIRSSVRVSDSLERGVSHFYAEVKKMKIALDATASPEPVLFLLDEVLHGTNSRERQIGARWILAELIEHGAIGAISTHDEELCRLPPELMTRVRLVHFRETVTEGKMTFDYRLREGPVKAGNALRVMRLAGLDVPLE
ncbi:MAG TPA: DNA mismatch repair protein MutS [Polyangiaceae bacterium]